MDERLAVKSDGKFAGLKVLIGYIRDEDIDFIARDTIRPEVASSLHTYRLCNKCKYTLQLSNEKDRALMLLERERLDIEPRGFFMVEAVIVLI